MGAGGFIQNMVQVIRENKAMLSSYGKKKPSAERRAGKTELKFPKGNPAELKRKKKRYQQRSRIEWLIIFIILGTFFGAMMFLVFY
tara:strand:+ start:27638 stop:27895 length:258 start_codon:yes stop_codon:yes gene_type:complete